MSWRHISRQRAFTLAEVAVIVVIVSIMMTASLKIMLSDLNAEAENITKLRQEKIKQALMDYLAKNKRLPCPDTGPGSGNVSYTSVTPSTPFDGTENRVVDGDNTSDCIVASFKIPGIVPYQTLGLSQEDVLDGWQNYFSYRPETVRLTKTNTFTDLWFNALININNRPTGQTSLFLVAAAFSLVSHGKNGLGAFTSKGTRNALPPTTSFDERKNTEGGLSTYMGPPTETPAVSVGSVSPNDGGPFDDIVTYMTLPEIMNVLRQNNAVNDTLKGDTVSQLNEFARTLEGYILSTCNVPSSLALAGITSGQATDRWGRAITYTPGTGYPARFVAGTGTNTIFTLKSNGPDPSLSVTTEDISLTMNLTQLSANLPSYTRRCP